MDRFGLPIYHHSLPLSTQIRAWKLARAVYSRVLTGTPSLEDRIDSEAKLKKINRTLRYMRRIARQKG